VDVDPIDQLRKNLQEPLNSRFTGFQRVVDTLMQCNPKRFGAAIAKDHHSEGPPFANPNPNPNPTLS